MPSRIVIVDETPTQRIVISAALRHGGLASVSFATIEDAMPTLQRTPNSIIIASHNVLMGQAFYDLKHAKPRHWVTGIIAHDKPDLRLAALAAGADVVLSSPLNPTLLCAKLRRMQRHHTDEDDLLPSWDNARALGFAEQSAGSLKQSQISVCSPDHALSPKLARLTRAEISALGSRTATELPKATDVVILDQRKAPDEGQLVRQMADLRAHAGTRQIMQMVLFGPDQAEAASIALDVGADDVLVGTYAEAEIAHRASRLIRRKHASEAFRNRVRDGLRAAVTDPLTGLANRRFAVPKLIELSNDTRPIAVCILDLDHFKSVNDRYGHAVGDDVLAAIAARLRNNAGPQALVARLGGEEFLVAAKTRSPDSAEVLAQRLGAAIKDRPVSVLAGRKKIAVTASIGVSYCDRSLPNNSAAEELLHRTDQALYASKHAGRDRVTLSETAA